MRFLGPHSAGEGPHLVPISLKFGSPSGPHFEKSGSPGLVGTVQVVNTMQSVLSEFIADGLNEGVSREVGSSSMMQ